MSALGMAGLPGLLLALAALSALAPAGRAAPGETTPLRVGSKQFTESVLLGELAAQVLRDSGLPAVHERELGGTRVLYEALRAGRIDVYAEYTGTITEELIPSLRSAAGSEVRLEELAAALLAQGVVLGPRLGFDDTYAIGMKRARAAALGMTSLGELAQRPELELGLSNEFLQRKDGWPRLQAVYGFHPERARGMDHAVAYRAVQDGAIAATDLYSTDAEIAAGDLVALRDERGAFPRYEAVLLYRKGLPLPAGAALRRLEGLIDERAMIGLNARARLQRVPEPQVAADFLRERLGVVAAAPENSRWRRIRGRTLEHLWLVFASLLGAVAAGVPLGILAAQRRRLGRLLLGLSGVLQIVPSLALLVLLVPLLGIGARPAIAALFLYGLLPIVRGTHAGLTGIAPELRETAAALGLPAFARLRLVELPLASRVLLAGVQTSAVINVGTATLGALVGAGGYGQPILAGVRLADTSLLLEGALPAAALAILVQFSFDLLGSRLRH